MSYGSEKKMKRVDSGKRIMGLPLNGNNNENIASIEGSTKFEDYEKNNTEKVLWSLQKSTNGGDKGVGGILPQNLFQGNDGNIKKKSRINKYFIIFQIY